MLRSARRAGVRCFWVDPVSGQREVLSDFGDAAQGPLGDSSVGVAVAADGTILVIDLAAGTSGRGALFTVDLSGYRKVFNDFGNVQEGVLGVDPHVVAVTADGTILVSDRSAGILGRGALFKVDPVSKLREVLSDFGDTAQGPLGEDPVGVAVTTDGIILVLDTNAGTDGRGALFTVDRDGRRTLLSDFGNAVQGPLGQGGPHGVMVIPNCGNGVQGLDKQCDDGNRLDGDGCSATCHVEGVPCGNGIVDAGEDCDVGSGVNGTAEVCCTASCTFVPNDTTCDDGNPATSGDICTTGVCAGHVTLLTVLTPNGGETWASGSTRTIQWNPSGVNGKMKIELSRNNGATWTLLFNKIPNDGTENWTVTGPATSQALVRVSSMNTPSIADISNSVFTISGGSVTVIAPNGGEQWAIGSKHTIQWSSSGLSGKVKVELSRDGGSTWAVLSNNVTNTGSLSWKVSKPATTQARIRISGVSDPGAVDTSNANFTIQ